jgi:RHS repeat-associated protein
LVVLETWWARGGTNYPFLTLKEREIETGLDYFGARYYASTQGRFTSPDPLYIELRRLTDPQQLNIYSYTRNNPLRFTDPNGLDIKLNCDDTKQCNQAVQDLNNRNKGQFKVEVKDEKLKVVGRVDASKLSQRGRGSNRQDEAAIRSRITAPALSTTEDRRLARTFHRSPRPTVT